MGKVGELPRDEHGRLIYDMYARMSVGLDGKEENVENQIADMERLAERLGVTVGERLADGLSAWKRHVRRPGWNTLIERMEKGLSAGVLIWHVDRLMRLPRDLEQLLALADDRHLKLASVHGTRDLQDPDDRFILRIEVAHACRSSDDTSRRSKRKNQGRRERGVLVGGGPRPFGWPGKDVTPERLRAEREALQWAYQHIASGGKLAAIARKWNDAGLLSFYGRPWYIETVRQCMKHQRYAGRITHNGEVVGQIADHEPLIDPELFDRVQGIFAARAHGRPAGKTSLCSGLIHCSQCGTPMVSRPRYRYRVGQPRETVPSYKCSKSRGGCGGPQIDQEPTDEMVRLLTLRRLSDPAVSNAVAALRDGQSARIDQVRAELETARQTEMGLAAKLRAKRISWEAFDSLQESVFADVQRLEAELKELEAAASDLTTVRAQSEAVVAAEWDAAAAEGDIARLRTMVQQAFPPRVARIMVRPSGKGKLVPPKARVEVVAASGIRNTKSRVSVGAASV